MQIKVVNLILLGLLLVAITGLRLGHDQCSCGNCCPGNMILNITTLRCICPPATPLIDSTGKCLACDPPNYWDASTRSCLNCTSNVCTGCPSTFVVKVNANASTTSYLCACPDSAPYVSAINTCINCTAAAWNATSKTCNGCDPTLTYDATTNTCLCPAGSQLNGQGKCVTCAAPGIWDSSKLACMACPPTFLYDLSSGKCTCPAAQPYLTANMQCVSCNAPMAWDSVNAKCFGCAGGQTLDPNTKNCVCPTNLPNFDGYNCLAPCPAAAPIWNGRACVACPAGTIFDGRNLCYI